MNPVRQGLTQPVRQWLLVLTVLLAAATALSAQSSRPGTSGTPDQAAKNDRKATETNVGDVWDAFTVDISVRRSRVDQEGKPAGGAVPDVVYRWVRERKGSGWKTTLTTLRKAKIVVQSLDGPKELEEPTSVARMEDDEDGTPFRFYDGRGKAIALPSLASVRKRGIADPFLGEDFETLLAAGPMPRPRADARDWAETFVMPAAKKDARKKGFEQKYGRARGQIRGLDRFLTGEPDNHQELLVDREFNVPVEMNLLRNGALLSHTTFSYERGLDNSLVRRHMRVEHQLADEDEPALGKGHRLVSDIDFTNVRFEKKGGAR